MQYIDALGSLKSKATGIVIASLLLVSLAIILTVTVSALQRRAETIYKAWAHYQKGQYTQCQKLLENSEISGDPCAKNIKALCLMHTNHVHEAIVVLKGIASSTDCLYMANLAYAYVLNGQDDEAWKISDELRTHYEARSVARVNFVRGLLEERQGNLDTALDEFSTAAHIDQAYPFPDTLVEMAALEQKMKDPAGVRWAKNRLQNIHSEADAVLGR
jgi:tetratricopeptide (TPR) repeat protein